MHGKNVWKKSRLTLSSLPALWPFQALTFSSRRSTLHPSLFPSSRRSWLPLVFAPCFFSDEQDIQQLWVIVLLFQSKALSYIAFSSSFRSFLELWARVIALCFWASFAVFRLVAKCDIKNCIAWALHSKRWPIVGSGGNGLADTIVCVHWNLITLECTGQWVINIVVSYKLYLKVVPVYKWQSQQAVRVLVCCWSKIIITKIKKDDPS